MHDEYDYTATCTAQKTCGWTETPRKVTEKTCTADEVCVENAGTAECRKIEQIALIVPDGTALEPIGGVQFATTTGTPLGPKEQAVENMLKSYNTPQKPLLVKRVPASQAMDANNLAAYKAVVATSYFPQFTPATTSAMLASGKGVVLLHDAVGSGQGGPGNIRDDTGVRITQSTGFFDKYDVTDPYVGITTGGNNYYFNIGGWQTIGAIAPPYWPLTPTVQFTTTGAGGRGVALGYDPSALTSEGNVMLGQMFRWIMGIGTASDTIDGKAALITATYKDAPQESDLTAQEKVLENYFVENGQTVQLVSQKNRFTADFSKAKAVASAHNPSGIRMSSFYNKLGDNTPVLLVYEATKLMAEIQENSGCTEANAGGQCPYLQVNADKRAFLQNYDQGNQLIRVVEGGKAYVRTIGNVIGSGWMQASVVLGSDGATHFRETAKARSAVFGYDIAQLTGEGKIMLKEAIAYVTGDSPKGSAPDGAWVLIAQQYENTPVLTVKEQAAKKLLEDFGLKVEVVPQAMRFEVLKYGNIGGAVIVNYPGIMLKTYYQALSATKPSLFLYDGGKVVGNRLGDASGGNLLILAKQDSNIGKGFLQNYDAGNQPEIHISDGGMFQADWVEGWEGLNQRVGCGGVCRVASAFSKETGTGDTSIRSAILAHDVSSLNNEGKVMLDEAIRWMTHNRSYAYTVPAGNVALLASDYNFDNKAQPSLTASETEAEGIFTGLGLQVTRVPQKNKFKTNWNNAVFAAVADSPPSGYPINAYLNTHAKSMLFLNAGLKALAYGSGTTDQNNFDVPDVPGRTESFMEAYAPGRFQIQTRTGAYVLPDRYWNFWGWTVVGREMWTSQAGENAFPTAWYVKNADRCGAAFGYEPDNLNAVGTLLLKNIIRWVYHSCYLPSQGKQSTETVETVHPYYSVATGTSDPNQDPLSCFAGVGEDTKNIAISSDIKDYVYKVELENYNMDDKGIVEINGAIVVNKDVCSYGEPTPCNGGPKSVPGKDCAGGCQWAGPGWTAYQSGGNTGCHWRITPKYRQIPMSILREGSNPVHVKAWDCICGYNTAEATIKVYKKTAP